MKHLQKHIHLELRPTLDETQLADKLSATLWNLNWPWTVGKRLDHIFHVLYSLGALETASWLAHETPAVQPHT